MESDDGDDFASLPGTGEYGELYVKYSCELLSAATMFVGFASSNATDESDTLKIVGLLRNGNRSSPRSRTDVVSALTYLGTDNLSASDLEVHEKAGMVADRGELANFMKHGGFEFFERRHATSRSISCTWVRKWKRLHDETKKIQSRLCAWGFSDPHFNSLTKHSSLATRLS